MTMLKQFYDYTESAGFSKDDILEEKGDSFTLVSFFEEGEKDIMYNITLVFYEDDSVEVYVRKSIHEMDMLDILQRINELNIQYCGVAFLIADDMLTVKSYVKANGNIEILLREVVQDVKLAQDEFVNFL